MLFKTRENGLMANVFCKDAPETLQNDCNFLKVSKLSLDEYTANFMDVSNCSENFLKEISKVHQHREILDVILSGQPSDDSGSTTPPLSSDSEEFGLNAPFMASPSPKRTDTSDEQPSTSSMKRKCDQPTKETVAPKMTKQLFGDPESK